MISPGPRQISQYKNFSLPENAGMHLTITALERLLDSPQASQMLKYFVAIDVFIEKKKINQYLFPPDDSVPAGAPAVTGCVTSIASCYDVCLVGFAYRKNEIDWQFELLKKLLERGLSVLCVCPVNMPQWLSFETCLDKHKEHPLLVQNALIDIEQFFDSSPSLTSSSFSNDVLAQQDWSTFQKIIASVGLQIRPEAFHLFKRVTEMSVRWEQLFSRCKIKHLIIRDNHSPENSSAAVVAKDYGVRVNSFQHSTLTSMPSVCPTFADVFYCYGKSSQQLLESFSDNDYRLKTKYRPIGMWNQTANVPEPDFDAKRILLIDQECGWSKKYFGNSDSYAQLDELMTLLLQKHPQIRWRLRLHFDNDRLAVWEELARVFPEQLELSLANSRLFADDLENISIVVGLFSTAVCEAAKLGFPVVFLYDPGWFYTPDLDDFNELRCTLDDFKKKCHSILNDRHLYKNIQNLSITAANIYYSPQGRGLATVADDIQQSL